jgi:hypothetical protein
MSSFLLHHRHDPAQCGVAYAAWRGTASPLRRRPAVSSCRRGGHAIWWVVDAPDVEHALGQLPRWLATRTQAIPIDEVRFP